MSNLMNWPLARGWECEICKNRPILMFDNFIILGLHWGIVHGQCHCVKCEAPYDMVSNPYTGIPKLLIKPEYKDATIRLWETRHIPVPEMTDRDFAEQGVPE